MPLKCRWICFLVLFFSLLSDQDGSAKNVGRKQQIVVSHVGGFTINLKVLELTDEQKQKVKDLRAINLIKARQLKENIQSQRLKMRQMLFNPQASDAKIREELQVLKGMQAKMDDIQVDDFLSIRRLLTTNQKNRLRDTMPK